MTTMLRIGAWCVNPTSSQISRDGETTRIEERTMRLLLCLADHAGEIVSIDDLLSQVWPGVNVSVDQLFNSSEKRLARVLLLLAHFGKDGVPESLIPRISQETLAEMVGTTQSRVSFFMNRFRKLGFITYDAASGLQVHSSLLNVVLHD